MHKAAGTRAKRILGKYKDTHFAETFIHLIAIYYYSIIMKYLWMIFINKTKWKLHYKTRTTPELLAYDRYSRTAEHSHMLESHMCLLPIGKIRNHSIYLCHVENRIKAEA